MVKDKQTKLVKIVPITVLSQEPTKREILKKLHQLKGEDWIKGGRPGNDGSVGNTVEDYLGIQENNFQTADAGEWELKSQRKTTDSMITLFHMDPQPRKPSSIVANFLLPNYGWNHKTLIGEKSFRATLSGGRYTDRGLTVKVDRTAKKVLISFDASKVDKQRHVGWLDQIKARVGLGEMFPQPFWTFDELSAKAIGKIKTLFSWKQT